MFKHRFFNYFKRKKYLNLLSSSKNRKLLVISLILIVLIVFFVIPSRGFKTSINKLLSMAGVYTEENKQVTLSNGTNPGNFTITKSADWIGENKAQLTINLKTKLKSSDKHKDVVLIIDNSGSMSGQKLDKVKEDSKELIELLLSDSNNSVSIISFNSTSEVLSNFSTNENDLKGFIDNLESTGGTNYNVALTNLDTVLSTYSEKDNTDLISLFITDGCPGEDTPNEIGTYHILKDKYNFLNLIGIQYEMGNSLKQELVKISDSQYVTDMKSLNNVLIDASINPIKYDSFIIDEYLDTNYFTVSNINDISTTIGEVTLDNNHITWNLSNLTTGLSQKMTIKLDLVNNLSDGYYPINSSLVVTGFLQENPINNSYVDTPVLSTNYNVNYISNAPSGCNIESNSVENYRVYSTVSKKTNSLSCEGYLFKGWSVEDNNIKYINDDTFIMPSRNINIRGTWTKHSMTKTMDGTVHEKTTLYKVLKTEAENNGLAKEYTGSHQDSMDASKSTQKIYHWYADNNTDGTAIQDKNNVIFAGHCWQMMRTTDTGGVKMIYNGEVENEQCLDTRGTHVGYASRTFTSLDSNYWYGTDYAYDSISKVFSLSGTTEQVIWNDTTSPTLIGKYTCKSTDENGTCSTLYLIQSYFSSTRAYVIPINSNSHYSQFGILDFNDNKDSVSDVGYMYNTRYSYYLKTLRPSESVLDTESISVKYWYADSVTWGSPTANEYNLDNPYQISSSTDYSELVGKYTFRNATQTYTSTRVYYIVAVNNTTMYYIELSNSGNYTLADFNYNYTYGDSYTDNGDGTYTINNPTTLNRIDWYTSYSNVGANKYVCKNSVNDTCGELWFTTYTSNFSMGYIPVANNYKYAKGFTWDGSKYVLDNDTSVTFWNINDSANTISLNNAHYTCWNETGECTTISYIYYFDYDYLVPYYINITNGKSIEDALNEMLYVDNVNTTNSTIKSGVDAWYKQYLSDYSDYLEDTIFCNDRTISSLGGWNPNGGSVESLLDFYGSSGLSCLNDTDKFSVSNEKAKLTYKISLMSYQEMQLLNHNDAKKTGQSYWLNSPFYFSDKNAAMGRYVDRFGMMDGYNHVSIALGVRPAISLIPGIEYSSGDGSMANPYIVDTNS